MEAIRDNGFDEMLALCGGNCSCATCHIYVDDAFRGLLAPPSREEVDLLEDLEARMPNSRLSCQILITPELDGISAIIAPMPEGD
jgi:2Fe-2S ferredoxin